MSNPVPTCSGVDTHCHVDLYPSPKDVVARAEEKGIATIAVTNAPFVFAHTQTLTKGARFVRPALGLHPELVRSHGDELGNFLRLLPTTRYVGEVGIDGTGGDAEDRRDQARVFTAILTACAKAGNKILTVHSRRASEEVIAAVGRSFPGVVILHWFSGPARDLARAIEYGMYFSVNPAMIRSVNGRKLIAGMPRDRVLTETDGPFVTMEKGPALPDDTGAVLPHLAKTWDCTGAEAQTTIVANFLRAVRVF